jgi:DNA-binding YbaB/EbfC family protein
MNINPFDLLKNAQKLQETMGDFQDMLGNVSVTGSTGAGMVEVDLNGKYECQDVRIAPEIAGDIDMMQDLIIAAINDAGDKVKDALREQVGALAGGMDLSGLIK